MYGPGLLSRASSKLAHLDNSSGRSELVFAAVTDLDCFICQTVGSITEAA